MPAGFVTQVQQASRLPRASAIALTASRPFVIDIRDHNPLSFWNNTCAIHSVCSANIL